jgi:hypothetical protein
MGFLCPIIPLVAIAIPPGLYNYNALVLLYSLKQYSALRINII